MGREAGFAIADLSVAHLDDDKVRKLWRALGDYPLMCEALLVHLAVMLASWRDGRRVSVADALPLWLPVNTVLVDELRKAGLLDRAGRIPAKSWETWHGPAAARKAKRVESGRLGGLAKAAGSGALASPQDRSSGALPVRPSVRPIRPSVPRAPRDADLGGSSRGGPIQSLGEAMRVEGGFAARLAEKEVKP